jgi:PhoPQ-activated pathogenicity-related protein
MAFLSGVDHTHRIVVIVTHVETLKANIPKLAVNAGGDEFLQVDDNEYWYHTMPGETHLLMVQDADHSMATGLEQVIPGTVRVFRQRLTLEDAIGAHACSLQ